MTGISSGVNYGVDKVRFPAAVPVGSRVRGYVRLELISEVIDPDGAREKEVTDPS